jgi:hypothetical protein
MTIKLIAKYCSMAVLALIVITTLGPADWQPRTALGWLFGVGGVLVAALLAELLILALRRRAGLVLTPQEVNDHQAGGHDAPS